MNEKQAREWFESVKGKKIQWRKPHGAAITPKEYLGDGQFCCKESDFLEWNCCGGFEAWVDEDPTAKWFLVEEGSNE